MDELKKKLFPADLAWSILNNLERFNERDNLIRILSDRFNQLKEHSILSKFINLYQESVNYYDKHGEFPDIQYLNKRFPDGKLIKIITGEDFSMSFFEDLLKTLDYEILIQRFNNAIIKQPEINIEGCIELSAELARFATRNATITPETKADWINCYKRYKENYKGFSTHIDDLDNVIGKLCDRSLSVLAAPSGHGKSTTAATIAYNAAMQGMVVFYISFEVPSEHMKFNFASIHSANTQDPNARLVSSRLKEGALTPKEEKLYEDCTIDMLARIKEAGGYLHIIDQTEIQADTFEQFKANLETISEQLGIVANLMIVDNVDNLQVMRSSERDETTKVNQYIIGLDKYSKTYKDGIGTHIMLLSQVNRTGLKKMMAMEGDDDVSLDVTCIQKFNALYEKATTVLVAYSTPKMRVSNQMKIMPVKLRNRPLPTKPIILPVEFEYSKVGRHYEKPVLTDDEIINGFSEPQEEGEFDVNSVEFGDLDE